MKHRVLMEFVSLSDTPNGGMGLISRVRFLFDLQKLAIKHKFEVYEKAVKKETLEYKPSQQKMVIKTVEDIAELTPEQFEMFIDDLRGWSNFRRSVKNLNKSFSEHVIELDNSGMTWIDNGKHNGELVVS